MENPESVFNTLTTYGLERGWNAQKPLFDKLSDYYSQDCMSRVGVVRFLRGREIYSGVGGVVGIGRLVSLEVSAELRKLIIEGKTEVDAALEEITKNSKTYSPRAKDYFAPKILIKYIIPDPEAMMHSATFENYNELVVLSATYQGLMSTNALVKSIDPNNLAAELATIGNALLTQPPFSHFPDLAARDDPLRANLNNYIQEFLVQELRHPTTLFHLLKQSTHTQSSQAASG